AGEADDAAIRADEAGDHVEDGGLAGAVGAEQAHGLAGAHVQARILYHGAAAIALLQALDRQDAGTAEDGLALAAGEDVRSRPGRTGVEKAHMGGTGLRTVEKRFHRLIAFHGMIEREEP